MAFIDKASTLFVYQTIVGMIGFLIIVLGTTTTNNLYGEIEDVEQDVLEYRVRLDSQEDKINEINLIVIEIFVGMKWQKDNIEHIVTKLNTLESN